MRVSLPSAVGCIPFSVYVKHNGTRARTVCTHVKFLLPLQIRSAPLLFIPILIPINIDMLFVMFALLFYGFGTFLHWGYESTVIDAHNPVINTAYQRELTHAGPRLGSESVTRVKASQSRRWGSLSAIASGTRTHWLWQECHVLTDTTGSSGSDSGSATGRRCQRHCR